MRINPEMEAAARALRWFDVITDPQKRDQVRRLIADYEAAELAAKAAIRDKKLAGNIERLEQTARDQNAAAAAKLTEANAEASSILERAKEAERKAELREQAAAKAQGRADEAAQAAERAENAAKRAKAELKREQGKAKEAHAAAVAAKEGYDAARERITGTLAEAAAVAPPA